MRIHKVKTIQRSRILGLLICFALLLSLRGGFMLGQRTSAQNLGSGQVRKVSSDLKAKVHDAQSDDTVKVILQLTAPMSADLNSLLNSNGVHVRKTFKTLGAHAVDMPASIVDTVACFPEVFYVSLDRPTASLGHISLTTGADAVRATSGITVSGVDGTGIGIAVLDSGIFTGHTNF